MTRTKIFNELSTAPFFDSLYGRLSAQEVAVAEGVLDEFKDLDRGDFESAINRYFLDRPKPKGWAIIIELLSCANSRLR